MKDEASFDAPHRTASGFVHVFVNGVAAVEEGRVTGKRAVPTYVYFYDNSMYRGGYYATGTSTITIEACDDVSASNVSAIPFKYQKQTGSDDTYGALTSATTAGFSSHRSIMSILASRPITYR